MSREKATATRMFLLGKTTAHWDDVPRQRMFRETAGRASTCCSSADPEGQHDLVLDSDQPPAAEVGSIPKSVCFTTILPVALSVSPCASSRTGTVKALVTPCKVSSPCSVRSYELGAIRLPVTSTERTDGAVARDVEHARPLVTC